MYNQHKILRVFQLINLLKSSPPKSIRALSKTLNIDSRSVYRYFDLLRELGFNLEKDTYNRFYITNEEKEDGFSFSPEEAGWLKELISTVGKESYLKDSILKKLYVNSDLKIQFYKYLAEKVQPQVVDENLILNSFIISNTKWLEVNWKESLTISDFNEQHVFFQEEQSSDYIDLLINKVII